MALGFWPLTSESCIITSNEKDIARRRSTREKRSQRGEGSEKKKGRARRQKGQRRQRLATVVTEARAFPRAMQISTCQPHVAKDTCKVPG